MCYWAHNILMALCVVLFLFMFQNVLVDTVCAEPNSKIGVVGVPPDHALNMQLQAELQTLGFQVVVIQANIQSFREVKRLAKSNQVKAAIWITDIDQPTIEIWVVDLITNKTIERTIDNPTTRPSDRSRLIALQTIELLRASLREQATSGTMEQKTTQKIVPSLTSQEDEHPSYHLSMILGPVIILSPGGLPPSLQVGLGLSWAISSRWGLSLRVQISPLGVEIEEEAGTADIRMGDLAIGPYLCLTDFTDIWQIDIGSNIGTSVVYMQGYANQGLESRSVFATSAIVYGYTGLSYKANSNWRFRVEGQIGSLVPEVTVRFAGKDIVTWGYPFAAFSAMLGLFVY